MGDTIQLWIVDVDGTGVLFEAETRERAGFAGFEYDREQLEQEIQEIVDSIRFD